jgi:hypothetical protein
VASIRERGKFWEVRVRREGQTLSRSFATKEDAWAVIIESEIERGVFIDRKEAEKTPSVTSSNAT